MNHTIADDLDQMATMRADADPLIEYLRYSSHVHAGAKGDMNFSLSDFRKYIEGLPKAQRSLCIVVSDWASIASCTQIREPVDPNKPKWLLYEELAAYLLNRMPKEFHGGSNRSDLRMALLTIPGQTQEGYAD